MTALPADLAFQKRFVAKARRELGLTRASYQPGYLRDYDRAMRRLRAAPVSEAELKAALLPVDLLLVADFHTLALSQQEAASLLKFWTQLNPSRPVILALECLTARDQGELDDYLSGDLQEAEFLRRVRWQREWGFPFDHYRPLFTLARELGVRVLALDAWPRGDFREVRGRDQFIAARLAELRRATPAACMALIGETHLAPGHLPLQLTRALARLKTTASIATVLQNVDQIYWRLSPDWRERHAGFFRLRPEPGGAKPRGAGGGTQIPQFMVLSASPVQKYESWREYMAAFGEPRAGVAPVARGFYDLIDSLLGVLRIPKTLCVKRTETEVRFLTDCYPEVLGPGEFAEFGDRVHGSAMPDERKQAALARAPEIGRFYCAPLNLMWIGDAPLRDLAESAGYFINLQLKDRVGRVRPLHLPFADRLAERILEEALSYLGSKFVGPERQFHRLETLAETLEWLEATGVDPRSSLEWEAEMRRFRRAQPLLEPLSRAEAEFSLVMRQKQGAAAAARQLEARLAQVPLFVLAVHEWGYDLGEKLFDRVQRRRLSIRAIRAAFTRRFEQPGEARKELSRLVKLTSANPVK